jgi:hypothetical protein
VGASNVRDKDFGHDSRTHREREEKIHRERPDNENYRGGSNRDGAATAEADSKYRDKQKDNFAKERLKLDTDKHGERQSTSKSTLGDSQTERHVWGNVAKEEEEAAELAKKEIPEEKKEKADFGLSGALAKDAVTGNVHNGMLISYRLSHLINFI